MLHNSTPVSSRPQAKLICTSHGQRRNSDVLHSIAYRSEERDLFRLVTAQGAVRPDATSPNSIIKDTREDALITKGVAVSSATP